MRGISVINCFVKTYSGFRHEIVFVSSREAGVAVDDRSKMAGRGFICQQTSPVGVGDTWGVSGSRWTTETGRHKHGSRSFHVSRCNCESDLVSCFVVCVSTQGSSTTDWSEHVCVWKLNLYGFSNSDV